MMIVAAFVAGMAFEHFVFHRLEDKVKTYLLKRKLRL